MLSLSLVKCCDKSAKCYGHLGGDGGAHTHVRVDLFSAVKTT